jgi:hypothetical protein
MGRKLCSLDSETGINQSVVFQLDQPAGKMKAASQLFFWGSATVNAGLNRFETESAGYCLPNSVQDCFRAVLIVACTGTNK